MSVAGTPAAPPRTTFARRHAWLVVLVVGTALFIAEERTLVATQNPNLVPSAILLGASIVPLAFVAFVYGRRLPYRVPGPAVAAINPTTVELTSHCRTGAISQTRT